ncbi:MAG: hypothetical protein K0U39_01790 [Alphaproteobacteria bacterium]|nr:hypothetical protein [Alphaproteobacteria bacterium]
MMLIVWLSYVRCRLVLWLILLSVLPFFSALSQGSEKPAYQLIGDEIFYDEKSNNFQASGDVKIIFDDTIIWADRVSYYDDEKIIRASGNVIYKDKNMTLFTHQIMLNDRLKRQEMQSIAMRFDEKKRLRANYMTAENDKNETIFNHLIYTPCRECFAEDGTEKTPIWQIRSRQTVMNSEKKTMSHRQLYLDVNGKTVLYLPRLLHVYDSSVPLSGALAPSYGSSNRLGFFYAQPLYLSLSRAKDLTIVPVYSSSDKHLFTASYRMALSRGSVATHFTATGEARNNGANQSNENLRGDESFFSRVNFNNQLNQNMRISGNFHYLQNQNFFSQYRQNTEFNQYGRVATSYQDHVTVEQFHGRDYIFMETRYKHRLRNEKNADDIDYYVFPLAQFRYHGGQYYFAGGYVQGKMAFEELQRTSHEQGGREGVYSTLSYDKDIWVSQRTLFEVRLENIGASLNDRAHINRSGINQTNIEELQGYQSETDQSQRFARRSVNHYYSRIRHNFNYIGNQFIVGWAPEFVFHNSKGDANNDDFLNEDSTLYIADTGSLLALQPLGNGDDIVQMGRRKAFGSQFYYQGNNGVYASFTYARADITTFDAQTNQTLGIYSGKTDHVLNLTLNKGWFSWQQDTILARENDKTLASDSTIAVQASKYNLNVTHQRYNSIYELSPEQRYNRLRQANPEPPIIEESAIIGLKYHPSETFNWAINTKYDIENQEFLGASEFIIEKLADCFRFQVKYSYDATITNELEKTVLFSVELVN